MEIEPSSHPSPDHSREQPAKARLRARYIALAVGLAIVPLVLISLLVQQGLRARLEKQQEARLVQSMSALTGQVTNQVDHTRGRLRTIATLPSVAALLRAQENLGVDVLDGSTSQVLTDRLQSSFRSFGLNDKRIRSLRLIDIGGRVLARQDFQDGEVLSPETWVDLEPARDAAFLNTYRLPEGRIHVSQLATALNATSQEKNSTRVSFAMPVHLDGTSRAVVIMDMTSEVMLDQAFFDSVPGSIVLADSRGQYATRADGGAQNRAPRSVLFADWPGLDPRRLDIVQRSQSNGSELVVKLIDVNPEGTASFWMVGIVKDGSASAALLKEMGGLVLQWAVILGVIAISVALVMAELISKPLIGLAQVARKVRGGDLAVRAQVSRKDEVGDLAQAFNTMLDALQVSNKSLVDARELAEEAARTKAAFLANMSHEIRTPMNGVIGMLGLLSQTELDPTQRNFTATAKNSAEALMQVLNDVLDFSKIEAGKLSIEQISFDLRRLVEECIALTAHRAQEKQLQLLSYVSADIPPNVIGDPTRIRQLLLNLLGNAVKFTERGEVSLTLRARAEAGGRYVVRFDIKDSGIGLTEAQRNRLFIPFVQADESTTRNYGGTGLGLAICQRLVALMNGEIGVDSKSGQGSLFWFEIPLRKSESAVQLPGVPAALSGSRVLIVDDDATNRLILEQHLAHWGLHTVCVDGPGSALQILRQAVGDGRPFDLAILDMRMPAMDGISLARLVCDELGNRQPKMLLLSSLANVDIESARVAGIDLCLSRPVSQLVLLESVARVMGASVPPVLTQESHSGRNLSGRRILLVEDNLVNQQVALYTLRRMGVEVSVAGNGKQAIEQLSKNTFDLVLMDCQMPEMDGFEATRRLRNGEAGTDRGGIPVIAMTANALEGDRERCLAAGMNDYIPKPFKPENLRAVLELWLERQVSGTSSEDAQDHSVSSAL